MTKFLMPHFCPVCPEIRLVWDFLVKNQKSHNATKVLYVKNGAKWGTTTSHAPMQKTAQKRDHFFMQKIPSKKHQKKVMHTLPCCPQLHHRRCTGYNVNMEKNANIISYLSQKRSEHLIGDLRCLSIMFRSFSLQGTNKK